MWFGSGDAECLRKWAAAPARGIVHRSADGCNSRSPRTAALRPELGGWATSHLPPATGDRLPLVRTGLEEALRLAAELATKVDLLRPEEAFVARIDQGSEPVQALFTDPLLPPTLLPEDWPAPALRRAFAALDGRLAKRSAPFVQRALDT